MNSTILIGDRVKNNQVGSPMVGTVVGYYDLPLPQMAIDYWTDLYPYWERVCIVDLDIPARAMSEEEFDKQNFIYETYEDLPLHDKIIYPDSDLSLMETE